MRTVKIDTQELVLGGKYLGDELRESNDIANDPVALQSRMEEDGYLLIRQLHDGSHLHTARMQILELLNAKGALDPDASLADGVVNPNVQALPNINIKEVRESAPALEKVVKGEPIMRFFVWLLGDVVLTFDYQWARAVHPGNCRLRAG